MKEAIEKDESFVVKCVLNERLLEANTMYLVIVTPLPSYKTSLLHLAALHNAKKSTEVIYAILVGVWHRTSRETMCQVLVSHDAEIDIRDGQERTPLHIAAQHGSLGVAEVRSC